MIHVCQNCNCTTNYEHEFLFCIACKMEFCISCFIKQGGVAHWLPSCPPILQKKNYFCESNDSCHKKYLEFIKNSST